MAKIIITYEADSIEEAIEFLNGKQVVPIPEPPIVEPPVVEPPVVEPPIVEPPVVEPPEPEPEPEPEPQVSVEIEEQYLPSMATIGFDLDLDLTNALPLKVNNKDVIALKLMKVPGWVWKMTDIKNVALLMPYQDFYIVKCTKSNTETHVTFNMVNELDQVGVSLYVEFAVAIG